MKLIFLNLIFLQTFVRGTDEPSHLILTSDSSTINKSDSSRNNNSIGHSDDVITTPTTVAAIARHNGNSSDDGTDKSHHSSAKNEANQTNSISDTKLINRNYDNLINASGKSNGSDDSWVEGHPMVKLPSNTLLKYTAYKDVAILHFRIPSDTRTALYVFKAIEETKSAFRKYIFFGFAYPPN